MVLPVLAVAVVMAQRQLAVRLVLPVLAAWPDQPERQTPAVMAVDH